MLGARFARSCDACSWPSSNVPLGLTQSRLFPKCRRHWKWIFGEPTGNSDGQICPCLSRPVTEPEFSGSPYFKRDSRLTERLTAEISTSRSIGVQTQYRPPEEAADRAPFRPRRRQGFPARRSPVGLSSRISASDQGVELPFRSRRERRSDSRAVPAQAFGRKFPHLRRRRH